MHWWQCAFTPSPKRHSDDVVSGETYSMKPGLFSPRNHSRSRQFRDAESRRSPSRSDRSPTSEKLNPQPLPMPEPHMLLKKNPKSVPFPSRGASREKHNMDDDVDGLQRINRLVPQNPLSEIPSCSSRKKSAQKQIPKARSCNRHRYHIDIPASAPCSPYSSPLLSPDGCDVLTTYYATPLFHIWSAPETPYSCDGHNIHCQESPTCRASNVHPLPLPPQPGSKSPASSRADFSGAPLQPPSISDRMESQWQKGKLIGRGTFGSVYVASNRETGALCAMKEVDIFADDSNSSERIRQLEQEINVLSRLKHPNIVQYFGSEIVSDKFHIYLEYVHPGSINKFIQDQFGAITESIVRNFTRHILCGLAYLHRMKTIHRDIKCANLLVDAYGVVKLADFGMAKHLNGEVADLSLKGSPYWLAPELLDSAMLKGTSSDNALAVDIWSLGCTIIEMMNGKPPWSEYEGAAALFKVLKETPPIPDTLSSDGKDFLKCCFRRNPANRPTASDLLDHPFVNYSPQLKG